MKWLISETSNFINFNTTYVQNITSKSNLEVKIEEFDLLLTPENCIDLYNLTYLNAEYPFGKIEMKSYGAKISTDQSYIQDFNSVVKIASTLVFQNKSFANIFKCGVRCVVPLDSTNPSLKLREGGSGRSAHWLKEAIFLSMPWKSECINLEVTLNLVHELGHQILMKYQDADKIIEQPNLPIFSSVRKVHRPAILSFHALVAVYFMLVFFTDLKSLRNSFDAKAQDFIDNQVQSLYSDFCQGAYALKEIKFTKFGNILFKEMLSCVNELRVFA